jgi:hypothetical protein
MLANDLQSEADIFLDKADPFPGPVICPVSSTGQMSGQWTLIDGSGHIPANLGLERKTSCARLSRIFW